MYRVPVYYTMSPQPAWVVFTEIQHTSRIQIKELTEIDPVWLEVLAPHYYEKVAVRT
jgi:ATP-dependent RNA helicase DDX35